MRVWEPLAAFLVARGSSALFQVVVQPPAPSLDYRNASAFPSLSLDPGVPLEVHAREVRTGAFERRWSKLTVLFDCESYTGTFLPVLPGQEVTGTPSLRKA